MIAFGSPCQQDQYASFLLPFLFIFLFICILSYFIVIYFTLFNYVFDTLLYLFLLSSSHFLLIYQRLGRPIAGQLNFNPAYLYSFLLSSISPYTLFCLSLPCLRVMTSSVFDYKRYVNPSSGLSEQLGTVLHEITHVLGFDFFKFNYFNVDPTNQSVFTSLFISLLFMLYLYLYLCLKY